MELEHCNRASCKQIIEALRAELAEAKKDFCAAINHAITLNLEAADFLRCWNEGNWEGCAEFDFKPSAAMAQKEEA